MIELCVEFKIKMLKNKYNLENSNDKIRFLKEITRILSEVDNKIEREIYIDKISSQYNISKEAIYAEVNKESYKENVNEKVLDHVVVLIHFHLLQTFLNEQSLLLMTLLNHLQQIGPL